MGDPTTGDPEEPGEPGDPEEPGDPGEPEEPEEPEEPGEPETPPEVPADAYELLNCLVRANPLVEITSGPWTGWFTDPAKVGDQIGDGSRRGLADRLTYYRVANLGNHFRLTVDLMVPLDWWEPPGGGKHWGGTGICPIDEACRDDCLRLDWSTDGTPGYGFDMQVYQTVDGHRAPEQWFRYRTDRQVFFEGEWTTVEWEAEYDPPTGRLTSHVTFSHRSYGSVRVDRNGTIAANNPVPIGETVKWAGNYFNCVPERDAEGNVVWIYDSQGRRVRWKCIDSHPGQDDTCWIRNEHWEQLP